MLYKGHLKIGGKYRNKFNNQIYTIKDITTSVLVSSFNICANIGNRENDWNDPFYDCIEYEYDFLRDFIPTDEDEEML
jgi:hypothetical protein